MTAIAVGAPQTAKGVVGYLYMLPITETPPSDALVALGANKVDLGYVSSEGITLTSTLESDMIQDWNLDDVLQVKTGSEATLAAPVFGWGKDQAKAIYGEDSVIDTANGFYVAWAGELPPHVWLVAELRGKNGKGRLVVDAQIASPGEVNFVTNAPIQHTINAALFKNAAFKDAKDRDSYYKWFDEAASTTPATGATAGSPGTFTPAGAIVPADLAAMSGLTATPGTAWAAGQYVRTADMDKVRWSGTAWQ